MHLMVYGVSPCFLNLTGAVKITKTNTFQFLLAVLHKLP